MRSALCTRSGSDHNSLSHQRVRERQWGYRMALPLFVKMSNGAELSRVE